MTCVIAVPDGSIVHMAADKAASGEGVAYQEQARKIDRFPSGLLVGFAGAYAGISSIRLGGLGVDRALPECDPSDERSLERLSSFLRRRGALTATPQFWVELLLAMNGALVYMHSLKPRWVVSTGPQAIGIGGPVALRSWWETPDLPHRERLGRAIEAAAEYAPGRVSRARDYEQTIRSVSGSGMVLNEAMRQEGVADFAEMVVLGDHPKTGQGSTPQNRPTGAGDAGHFSSTPGPRRVTSRRAGCGSCAGRTGARGRGAADGRAWR